MAQAGLPMVRKITDDLNAGSIATADQLRKAFEAMIKALKQMEEAR